MEAGVQAASWVVGKALSSVSGGVLEAWAASSELGSNIRALRMELLYAQGMLNNARGRGPDQEMQNPALTELLQELKDLGYRADDVLDELDYFRIQDELDGTNHAADEHQGGCLCNRILNARHTARAIAKRLGFSKCSRSDGHSEPAEDTRGGGSCGACLGIATTMEEKEEDASQGVICGALWPRTRASVVPPGCMGRLASGAQNTIHALGKHLPCYSACCAQTDIASSEPTPKLKFDRVEISRTMEEIVEQLKPVCAKVSTILNLELLDSNRSVAQWIATSLDGRFSNKQWLTPTTHKNATSRPITTSYFREREFHGRKDKTSKIIHDITKGEYCDKTLTVLPIVGPGGIGKTTLTQYIYNAEELKKHFEVKLWVCVSINFNVYRLTQEIADKLSNDKKDSPDKVIEESLKSKRFFLVLDDMWNLSDEDEWKRFFMHFTKGQMKGSVILVTTRFPAVAQMVKTVGHHIDLEGLDPAAIRELFLAYVFDDKKTQNVHSGLLEIGAKILEKLKGSPLAAKTVGRLLKNHLDLDHWTRVLESREWESQHGDHDIMPALKLSFDYLPFHLQQCFTYCALFPEDYKFGKEEIIHFWIGLDALHWHGENISIEDIGLKHLDELVSHGFLKMEEKEEGGTCYVIHDLLHELALKVSAHEYLSINSSSVSSIQILPSIRHLSINIDDSSIKDRMTFDDCKEDFSALDKRLKVENLHSLMLFGEHKSSFVKNFRGLFSKAKALRVIFISESYCSMEDLLPNYLNLIHLRYLRLRVHLGSGPCKNISRYYHLRVLHLSYQPPYGLLTTYMRNLIKLRHFLVDDGADPVHSRISKVGRLKSLQSLEIFVVKNKSEGFELREIGQLLELHGSLSIENLGEVKSREEAEAAKLMHKRYLRKILLDWGTDQSKTDPACEDQVLEGLRPNSNLSELSIIGHRGGKCPSWLSVNLSVKNLESLFLKNIAWKTFPPIGKLWLVDEELPLDVHNQNFNNLTRIVLVKLGVKKWVVDSTCQIYSCLKILTIEDCNELMELSFTNPTCGQQEQNTWFPKLHELDITRCPKLSSLPPVPWIRYPCRFSIREVDLGFKCLRYENEGYFFLGNDENEGYYTLYIKGTDVHHDTTDKFWRTLDFDNLTEVKYLDMSDGCPPIPFHRLKILSSLKVLNISNNYLPFVEEGRHVQFELPIQRIGLRNVAVSGKELTEFLSKLPRLSNLTIYGCEKITSLGVAEQKATSSSSNTRFPYWITTVGSLLPWTLNRLFPETQMEVERNLMEEEEMVEEGLLLLPPRLQELQILNCRELGLRPDPVGLQGLCSLRSLLINECPKFLLPYLAAATSLSSCSPFPASLQSLHLLDDVSLTLEPEPADGKRMASLSNLASLTHLEIRSCGDLRGFWRSNLPRGSHLTHLAVHATRNFFFVDPPDHDGSSSPFSNLQSLFTDDAPGVLVAPICSQLSSSLTKLLLRDNKEMEHFTRQQEEALLLLTSLQDLDLFSLEKLRCLPAAGLRGLPNLKKLSIRFCPSIGSLPKDGLPNSLEELTIEYCSSIRMLPKAGLPSSLRVLYVRGCQSEELNGHCRKLIGTIPIVKVDF